MTGAATLLVELVTEELPPKALPRLGESFGARIHAGLQAEGLVGGVDAFRWFATPRRLAMTLRDVLAEAPVRQITQKIMPVSVAFDAEGKPSTALLRKLTALGIAPSETKQFERRMDGKTETLFHTYGAAGVKLEPCLERIVSDSVAQLPIPKVMRWGSGEALFARPVHRLVMMHGNRVVAGRVLDLEAGNTTFGHRFMSRGEIPIDNADEYAQRLLEEGRVIADFAQRRAAIEQELRAEANRLGAVLGDYEDLLDEVTALVELPAIYAGEFDAEFLAVPQECLILTMRQNQKYFPLFDQSGRLLSRFLIVSNMRLDDPHWIIAGNERVVRPRLADARFFFDQDRRSKLLDRVERLAGVVYHHKLGTQLDRVGRMKRLAGQIARRLHSDAAAAERAAWLAKADLVTNMVGEFPELQGIMGRYYARHDGEPDAVADAIEMHYRPRFAGDELPQGNVACAVSLADKLDALVGFFGIGNVPTGEKDPFGLRRAALGALRILGETPLPLDLLELIRSAAATYHSSVLGAGFEDTLHEFMLERLRHMLRDVGYPMDAIEAVLVQKPSRIDLVRPRLEAVRSFVKLPEATALAAANKRIANILKKADGEFGETDVALLQEEAERALFHQLNALTPSVKSSVENGDYGEALRALAGLRVAVDQFFDNVLVMAEEPLTRRNRLALLNQLGGLMNQVADISRLAVER